MNDLILTIDLDWACEAAIEETLDYFLERNISPTVFITHHSNAVEARAKHIDIGLHPFFGVDSSHGDTVTEVLKHVMQLPHNLKAFRCHRFAVCNASKQAMLEAGMLISSNVCTDLDIVHPFQDRSGLFEIPIFLEDGGYLWRQHPLMITSNVKEKLAIPAPKIILIHPMHFVINTPNFDYMRNIKKTMSREKWHCMSKNTLDSLRFKGRGIRDFIIDLFAMPTNTITLRSLYHDALIQRNPLSLSPELQN